MTHRPVTRPVTRPATMLLLLGLLAFLPGLGACSALKEALMQPSPEPDVAKQESYLSQGAGAARNQIDLGPDQQTLLEGFTKLKRDYFELKSKLEQVEAHNEQLRLRLTTTEKNLSTEMSKRAVAEAEAVRFKNEIRKRDAEFLSLSIKKAKRDHEYYALRVAALKDQLDSLNAAAYEANAPVGGRDR